MVNLRPTQTPTSTKRKRQGFLDELALDNDSRGLRVPFSHVGKVELDVLRGICARLAAGHAVHPGGELDPLVLLRISSDIEEIICMGESEH